MRPQKISRIKNFIIKEKIDEEMKRKIINWTIIRKLKRLNIHNQT